MVIDPETGFRAGRLHYSAITRGARLLVIANQRTAIQKCLLRDATFFPKH